MRALQVVLPFAFVMVALGTSEMASDRFVSAGEWIELAQTRTKQNRDERQGDRQDCRAAEGAVGDDKRDCKQDSRQEGSSDGG